MYVCIYIYTSICMFIFSQYMMYTWTCPHTHTLSLSHTHTHCFSLTHSHSLTHSLTHSLSLSLFFPLPHLHTYLSMKCHHVVHIMLNKTTQNKLVRRGPRTCSLRFILLQIPCALCLADVRCDIPIYLSIYIYTHTYNIHIYSLHI